MDNGNLFSFFRRITEIPRDSGDEKEIAEYLLSFAKSGGWKQ